MFTTIQEHGEVYQMKGILELKRLKISHMIIYAHIWIVLRTIYLIIFQMCFDEHEYYSVCFLTENTDTGKYENTYQLMISAYTGSLIQLLDIKQMTAD